MSEADVTGAAAGTELSGADVTGSDLPGADHAGSEAAGTSSQPSADPIPGDPGATSDVLPSDELDLGDASLLGLVDRLAAVLERSDLLELEVQAGSTALVLRRPEALAPLVAIGPNPGASPAAAGGGHAAAPADRSAENPTEIARASVKAPLTGIWYSAPAPGSAPFVQVGGEVAVGQVIGLIEAMKLFNEIKSDLAGRVVRVAAENGQLVKAKQPLIEVEPL